MMMVSLMMMVIYSIGCGNGGGIRSVGLLVVLVELNE